VSSLARKPVPVSPAKPIEIDRPLPHNLDAERSILGAVLLDSQALDVIEKLPTEDFFLPQHRHILQHMRGLARKQQAIELITVVDSLDRSGNLEAAGGSGYVSQLADGMPRVSNVEHYARIVKGNAVLRNLAFKAEAIKERALANQDEPELIVKGARELIDEVAASASFSAEPFGWQGAFHTWEEFESCPPLEWAIENFLQKFSAAIIAGLSEHGKTLLLCSIAKALLNGGNLWGLFPVRHRAIRIVYLIPECSLPAFKHRLKLFGIYNAASPNDGRLLVRTLSKGPAPQLSDPAILFAAKGSHVVLDTAARFGDGDENSASDHAKGLAKDIFALLTAGAHSVLAAHHSPKSFRKESEMSLENVLRGTGDFGAMISTAWGVRKIDDEANIVHIQNLKARDFQACKPFQLIGRPFIDETGDFRVHKGPGECGELADEQPELRNTRGASQQAREFRTANIAHVRNWLQEDRKIESADIVNKFKALGIEVGSSTARKYRLEALKDA
jgi:DnaB-like helicase N terminal domain/AAA domain